MVLQIAKITSINANTPPEISPINNEIIPPHRIISGKLSNGGFRPFLFGELFPPLFLEIDAASLATL